MAQIFRPQPGDTIVITLSPTVEIDLAVGTNALDVTWTGEPKPSGNPLAKSGTITAEDGPA